MTASHLPKPSRNQVEFARQHRKAMTRAEHRLWDYIGNRRLDDIIVRRQHPTGLYILDFYIPSARLAIEVDGSVHQDPEQRERDVIRDQWLNEHGVRVLRISNDAILGNVQGVVARIRLLCETQRRP